MFGNIFCGVAVFRAPQCPPFIYFTVENTATLFDFERNSSVIEGVSCVRGCGRGPLCSACIGLDLLTWFFVKYCPEIHKKTFKKIFPGLRDEQFRFPHLRLPCAKPLQTNARGTKKYRGIFVYIICSISISISVLFKLQIF